MTLLNKINEPEEASNDTISSHQDGDLQDAAAMEAYIELNKELDEISSYLDALEQKNDSLHAEIAKLLEESKQIRSEIKSESA